MESEPWSINMEQWKWNQHRWLLRDALLKHSKYFISESKGCQACKSNPNLFWNIMSIWRKLSDFPFVVALMIMHRHWSHTHFRLFLCIRFQNIRPVFGKFSLSLFFPKMFSSFSAGIFDRGREMVLQISDQKSLIKAFHKSKIFLPFLFLLLVEKWYWVLDQNWN